MPPTHDEFDMWGTHPMPPSHASELDTWEDDTQGDDDKTVTASNNADPFGLESIWADEDQQNFW